MNRRIPIYFSLQKYARSKDHRGLDLNFGSAKNDSDCRMANDPAMISSTNPTRFTANGAL
jgi:hypothetical protein